MSCKYDDLVLSSAYFAPIQFYTKKLISERVWIDDLEKYHKQSYRNRAVVLGANGSQNLTVPVVSKRSHAMAIKDIAIAYDMPWQKQHWKALLTAYNSSPFFEYYVDDIIDLFSKKYRFLFDLNRDVDLVMTSLLGIDDESVTCYSNPEVITSDRGLDLRGVISPKVDFNIVDRDFATVDYTQVFSDRMPFVANLSILDLLFNEGPNSISILTDSIR